ncbi:MAG: hypothetical protein Ta2D_12890 [Rickettsiales bacterium]|nr:MAG: hypothetical protein Ta2D_12890 [Rickettsiales bacterium]
MKKYLLIVLCILASCTTYTKMANNNNNADTNGMDRTCYYKVSKRYNNLIEKEPELEKSISIKDVVYVSIPDIKTIDEQNERKPIFTDSDTGQDLSGRKNRCGIISGYLTYSEFYGDYYVKLDQDFYEYTPKYLQFCKENPNDELCKNRTSLKKLKNYIEKNKSFNPFKDIWYQIINIF